MSKGESWSNLNLIAVALLVGVGMIAIGLVAFLWSGNLLVALAAPFVFVAVLGGSLNSP